MLYLVSKEIYGFETIFDALDAGRGGVGRNRDTIVDSTDIPEIPALLALTWSAERPLGPLQIAAFLGPLDQTSGIFLSILVDENITSVADFVEYGYAFYELEPNGNLIRLAADGTPLVEGDGPDGGGAEFPDPAPDAPSPPGDGDNPADIPARFDGIQSASSAEIMTGPFSVISKEILGFQNLNDLNGTSIAVVLGSPIEAALNSSFQERGFSYEPVYVPDYRFAQIAFQDGRSDVLIYPSRLIEEEVLFSQYQVLDGVLESATTFPEETIIDGEVVTGSDQPDNDLQGTSNNDILSGLAGNDRLTGGPGNDQINGGSGTDTAIYSGDQSGYILTLGPAGTTLFDRRGGEDGLDTLIDVELLNFGPVLQPEPFDLRVFARSMSLSENEFRSVAELYIAYFNRAPDAIGLNFWATAFANGTSIDEMATLFIDQPETRALYPEGVGNDVFVLQVYQNVLGRRPDVDGYLFWQGVLDSGAVGRDTFILEILRGAKAEPAENASSDFIEQQLLDQAYLANKIDVGIYFAVIKGMSDVQNATDVMREFGSGSQDDIEDAVFATDEFYAQALDAVDGEFLMPLVGVLQDPFVFT